MPHLQMFVVLSLALLSLRSSQGSPLLGQCVEQTYCTASLAEFHAQFVNLPGRIHERSIASWNYVTNVDLDRVPQVIFEANCKESDSCKNVDSLGSLETLPITIKMPVLRKSPRCATYALEFEPIDVACICATSRQG